MSIANKMTFDTFFPLAKVGPKGVLNEFIQAVYALPLEEVEFQNLILKRIFDSICLHLLPSMLPDCPEARQLEFAYLERIDGPKKRKQLRAAGLSSTIDSCLLYRHQQNGLTHDLIASTNHIDSRFDDSDRNFLIAKYAMLRDIFQPSYGNIAYLTVRFLGAAQLKHLSMAQSAFTDLDIYIDRQATVEDIITAFFVDQIPFEGFPEDATHD